jgi:hypothetical protein
MKRMVPAILAIGFFLFAQMAQAEWTPAKRLTWTSGASEEPAIAVDSSGYLHVVWQDYTRGNYEIYYKKSTDGATTWTASQNLTWNSGSSQYPAIAVDASDNLHVVWEDYTPGNWEIFYKKSTNGGATWTPNQRLTWNSGRSEAPAIAVGPSDKIHVFWHDDMPGNCEIYYKTSTNGGATWATSRRLTQTSGISDYPAIAVDSSGHIHLVWDDTTLGYDIYYKKSTDGGATWTPNQRLTRTSGYSGYPAIADDLSDNLHLVWSDSTSGNYEVYYRKSTNGGATWITSQRLTWTSSASLKPIIASASSDNIHLVWADLPNWVGEIYYKKSTDGGASWAAGQRLTWNSGGSYSPRIAVDSSDNLHVVWQDYTPGNYEIFYKKFVK